VLCHTPYGIFPGVSNVGIRPTTDSHGRVNCETHIIGMQGDLYGRRIRVEFLSKIRDEQRFNGVEELVAAIRKDAEAAVTIAAQRIP
jgi:riboflavin kinase/FMN adenylyltransferase